MTELDTRIIKKYYQWKVSNCNMVFYPRILIEKQTHAHTHTHTKIGYLQECHDETLERLKSMTCEWMSPVKEEEKITNYFFLNKFLLASVLPSCSHPLMCSFLLFLSLSLSQKAFKIFEYEKKGGDLAPPFFSYSKILNAF